MWYRIILSAREVTDKRGLKTVHQTPVKFEHPVFPFDDPNLQGDYNLGSGAKIKPLVQDTIQLQVQV